MIPALPHYFCGYDDVQERISMIDPRAYDKTRNHLEGGVSWLSPFVCHGVIDTTTLAESLLNQHSAKHCYRFLYELAWREYFHRTWQNRGDSIFSDLSNSQNVSNVLLPDAIQTGATGVDVLDGCLRHLVAEGTMHNHARMWTAGITCNTAQTHWKEPARWMHYHLLDGDLASNTLSWQWVAGTFSHKHYIANQENLNKYSGGTQSGTWLDCSYEALAEMAVPDIMNARSAWTVENSDLGSLLNAQAVYPLSGEVAIHSIWNLDSHWKPNIKQHVLFIDTDHIKQWPMSKKRWQLIRHWLPEGVVVMAGTLSELQVACLNASPVFKEYPACRDWPGQSESRRWLYPDPSEEYRSFSQFWKLVKKYAC